MGSVLRVLFGFLIACLVAGLVQVLFVVTPKDLLELSGAALSERLGYAGMQVLFAATLAAMFAAPFALLAAAIGEWMGWRSPTYYLLVGIAIAMAGFSAQFASESAGQPTIVNNYALKAFLTAGFFAGFTYWLVAGQWAGRTDPGVAEVVVPAAPAKPSQTAQPLKPAPNSMSQTVAKSATPTDAGTTPAPAKPAPSTAQAMQQPAVKPAPNAKPGAVPIQPLASSTPRPAGSVLVAGSAPKKT